MREWDWPKIIAAYEIIGGIMGAIIVSFFIGGSLLNLPLAVIGAPFLVLFLFSIYAGMLLWRNDIRGINLSILAQILQIFQFRIPGLLSYKFLSGLSLPLTLEFNSTSASSSFSFNFGLTSSFYFALNPEQGVFLFGINLFAIAAIMYFLELRQKGFPKISNEVGSDDIVDKGKEEEDTS